MTGYARASSSKVHKSWPLNESQAFSFLRALSLSLLPQARKPWAPFFRL
jgi:hypothetical protein